MDQLEKDKLELKQLRQELDWKQNQCDRIERAIEFGRCKKCNEPLTSENKNGYCDDYPACC